MICIYCRISYFVYYIILYCIISYYLLYLYISIRTNEAFVLMQFHHNLLVWRICKKTVVLSLISNWRVLIHDGHRSHGLLFVCCFATIKQLKARLFIFVPNPYPSLYIHLLSVSSPVSNQHWSIDKCSTKTLKSINFINIDIVW
jgi:hypothetical protein